MSKSLFYKVHLPQDLELRYVYSLIPWEYVLSTWNVKNVSWETCSVNFFCRFPWRSYKWLITRLNKILEGSFSVFTSSRKHFLSPRELISYGICYGALTNLAEPVPARNAGKNFWRENFFHLIKQIYSLQTESSHLASWGKLSMCFVCIPNPCFLGPATSKVVWKYKFMQIAEKGSIPLLCTFVFSMY